MDKSREEIDDDILTLITEHEKKYETSIKWNQELAAKITGYVLLLLEGLPKNT